MPTQGEVGLHTFHTFGVQHGYIPIYFHAVHQLCEEQLVFSLAYTEGHCALWVFCCAFWISPKTTMCHLGILPPLEVLEVVRLAEATVGLANKCKLLIATLQ